MHGYKPFYAWLQTIPNMPEESSQSAAETKQDLFETFRTLS
jgi:hypothetical protein